MSTEDRLKLSQLTISGFKSFDSNEHTIEFGDVTVLIGANGAGKSNVVSFFKMMGAMMSGKFQLFVGEQGFANTLLFLGPKKTSSLNADLKYNFGSLEYVYEFVLSHSGNDTMIFEFEQLFISGGKGSKPISHTFVDGSKESAYLGSSEVDDLDFTVISEIKTFQFHDTSPTSRFRNSIYINDDDFLRGDGANLAAFLFGLKVKYRKYYDRIIRHIQNAFPQFGDFVLRPAALNENRILLNWTEAGNDDYLFGPHQLSDGTLRFMALATLLLQPPEKLPSVIVIDEPELGLHPSALAELAGMVEIASRYAQVVLSTQSPRLLDEFEPENVVVVERDPITKSSFFPKLNPIQLKEWLERYSLSELWEKNVLGGKP